MKPVLFVTGHAPAYRVGAFERLHEREQVELALFGGRSTHGGSSHSGELAVPHRDVRPHELASLAGSGRYRAVVCPTGGRVAPLATWVGARRARTPVLLWASLWQHPRSVAHAFTYAPLRHMYRAADAVVTYGPHVSSYVAAAGARNVHVAPQSVDNAFWSAREVSAPSHPAWPAAADVRFLFAGRDAPEKGLPVLLAAWRAADLGATAGALVLAGPGDGSHRQAASADGSRRHVVSGDGSRQHTGCERSARAPIVRLGALAPRELRDVYGACDVLVVPSVRSRTFREPWGLVVNEAMNRELAVIATDAVGAAAGGLVRDGHNGLVVPAGEPRALARALATLAGDQSLRRRLAAAGSRDVQAYSHDAWAQGFSRALHSIGLSRGRW